MLLITAARSLIFHKIRSSIINSQIFDLEIGRKQKGLNTHVLVPFENEYTLTFLKYALCFVLPLASIYQVLPYISTSSNRTSNT